MPDQKLSDLTSAAPASGDLVYIVDVSDATDSPAGSSRRTTVGAVAAFAPVVSVAGKTGAVTLTSSDVGADASGAASAALSAHVAASDPHPQYALESSLGTLATQSGTFSGNSSGTNTGDQFGATTAGTLLGRRSGSSGAAEEIAVGSGLSLSGTTLTATGGGGGGAVIVQTQGFRLTTETAVPVSTADRTAQGTVYLTPCAGNQLALYDGSAWTIRSAAEVSLALSGLTSGANYDVFAYWTGSALALELSAAWTNDTTRADSLVRQDGVWVKSGAASRRYVGTIRTTGTATTEDSAARRLVWNADNRVRRRLFRRETTASWVYASQTWRQANANSANQVEAVIGLAGVCVDITLLAAGSSDSADVPTFSIGADSTTTPSSDVQLAGYHSSGTQDHPYTLREVFAPGIGRHFWAWLEYAASTQTHSGGAKSNIGGTVDA